MHIHTMHRIPKIFAHNFDRRKTRTHSEPPSREAAKPKPRLERSYASKNINYEFSPSSNSASSSSSSSSSYSSSEEAPPTRSFEFDSSKTSFRFDGNDGEFEIICKSLGLSGIDDFGIAPEEYEAMKARSTSASVQLCDKIEPLIDRIIEVCCDNVDCTSIGDDNDDDDVNFGLSSNLVASGSDLIGTEGVGIRDLGFSSSNVTSNRSNMVCGRLNDGVRFSDVTLSERLSEKTNECRGNGINGVRPPVLVPPPLLLAVLDKECSSRDTLRAFVPDGDTSALRFEGAVCLDEDDDGIKRGIQMRNGDNDEEGRRGREMRSEENCVLLSESYSFTTSSSDDSSSTTTGSMSTSSANGRFRRVITDWQKGELLGRGSFGSVYEGIADNGFFFAVKEVSLLDQGDEGKQRISQLEQEIALLSRFEHENIVQYYGTKKDESHLYIFLELVTKGSLLSLYQKYYLKDPQVSAYTRQILRGLKYLHDRDVVHRDIKCANILVDTMGLVKLADFGLAKATKLNDVKSCKGTAFWMAPEVVRSLGYGLPADIWSLGCTVLEMLTRSFPYSNLEWMSALFRIGRGERPFIPDSLSNDARDFILKCLQVDPSLRPTAAQLLDHPFVKRPLPSSSGTSPHNFSRRS